MVVLLDHLFNPNLGGLLEVRFEVGGGGGITTPFRLSKTR